MNPLKHELKGPVHQLIQPAIASCGSFENWILSW
jgi:hypothetical protein